MQADGLLVFGTAPRGSEECCQLIPCCCVRPVIYGESSCTSVPALLVAETLASV